MYTFLSLHDKAGKVSIFLQNNLANHSHQNLNVNWLQLSNIIWDRKFPYYLNPKGLQE